MAQTSPLRPILPPGVRNHKPSGVESATKAWNEFRGRVEPGETKTNFERLFEYQELVKAALDLPEQIGLDEIARLKSEFAGLIMQDERLRNEYYEQRSIEEREKHRKRKAPSHWEKKYIPDTIDEHEHFSKKEDVGLIVTGYGEKSKDDPLMPS